MRRRWMRIAFAVVVVGTLLAENGPVRARSLHDTAPWPTNPNWQQYVEAPTTREVTPARVLDVVGDVANAQGLTDASGSQTTTLTRGYQGLHDAGPDFWPIGTTASASSSLHSDSPDASLYAPGNALDGNVRTNWNDALAGSTNSYLDITIPSPVTLPGITLLFDPNGVPIDFQIQTLDPQTDNFITQARVTGNGQDEVALLFPAPVTTTRVRILITRNQNFNNSPYSRINEVYPFYSPPTYLVLDYGKEVGGQPEFDVAATQGNPLLGAAYSETRQWLTYRGDHFNDTFTSDFFPITQTALLTNPYIRGGERYEEVRLLTPGSVTLRAARIHYSAYLGTPDTFAGYFVSSDDLLNRIWYAGAYTVNLTQLPAGSPYGSATTTLPVVLDGAKRDRAVWEGDLSVSGPTLYYSSYATDYLKESLRLLGSYQYASGFVQGVQGASAPVHTGGLLPGTVGDYSASYSMYFVTNLADYYRYTGDAAFVGEEWPVVEREVAWDAQQVNAQGLFVTDASDGLNWHYNNNMGVQAYYNALYYRTLTDAALLAGAAGYPNLAITYRQRASALKDTINTTLFNDITGVYDISPTLRGYVAEDANAFAVLYGLASPENIPGILSAMNNRLSTAYGSLDVSSPVPDGFNQLIGPFMNSYDLWARFSAKDDGDAFALMRSEWGRMVESDPASTMWEVMRPDGCNWVYGNPSFLGDSSWAHGWSTGPTSALSRYVLGIAPLDPGYQAYQVQPHPGTLQWAEGQAPTPHGPIIVKWGQGQQEANESFSMEVQAPSGITGTIAVPAFGPGTVVTFNGQTAWQNGQFFPVAGITGAYTDTAYIYLTGVASGDNQLVSKATTQGSAPSGTAAATPTTSSGLSDSMARCAAQQQATPTDVPPATASPTSTATASPTSTATASPTSTATASPTSTATASPTSTATSTTTATNTPTSAPTSTPTPTTTLTATGIPAVAVPPAPTTAKGSTSSVGTPIANTTNRSTPTARAIRTPTSISSPPPLRIDVTPKDVFPNGFVIARVHTAPKAWVVGLLRVMGTRMVTVKVGKRMTHVQRTVVLYKTSVGGSANKYGQTTERLQVAYEPMRLAQGYIMMSTYIPNRTATRTITLGVRIEPLPLTIGITRRRRAIDEDVTIRAHTMPSAVVSALARVTETRTTCRDSGEHRTCVARPTVSYQTALQGHADSRGLFVRQIHVTQLLSEKTPLLVTVVARKGGGNVTRRVEVM